MNRPRALLAVLLAAVVLALSAPAPVHASFGSPSWVGTKGGTATAATPYRGEFGDGSDGAGVLDAFGLGPAPGFTFLGGTWTQTRPANFTTLTIVSFSRVVQPLAFTCIHVRDTLTWQGGGTVSANGGAATGGTPGSNPAGFPGSPGGAGGANGPGASPSPFNHSVGGDGGGSDAAGGTNTLLPVYGNLHVPTVWLGPGISYPTTTQVLPIGGGQGGGGGSGFVGTGGTWIGGGGGAGGGVACVMARTISGSPNIEAKGGRGGDASNVGGGTGSADGGGGGGGGVAVIVYQDKSAMAAPTFTLTGGAGGLGISGGGSGNPGLAGASFIIGP